MSCRHCQNRDEHQNSSFTFGLILGLIIGAIIAVIIYKNNKEKVFDDLKNKLTNFFSSSQKTETAVPKKHFKKPFKKEVVLPSKLIAQSPETKAPVSKSKPRIFKK